MKNKLASIFRANAAFTGPLLGLIAIFLLFTILAPPGFASAANWQTIMRQSAIVGTAALGMTLVIAAGGIDLSVGSVVALSTVVIAAMLDRFGAAPASAALCGIAAGAAIGLAISLLVTRLRVIPFIATLAAMLIVRGIAKGLAAEQKIDAPATWLGNLLAAGTGWPTGIWLMLAMAAATAVLLNFTVFGRHLLAIGSNEAAARLCGIRIEFVKTVLYTVNGAMAGLAGLLQFSRLTVGDPTVAIGLELEVIAAVIIGGGSLSGGTGSVVGTLIGALIMTTIANGCSQIGLPNWLQEIVTGAIIVAAVALDRWRTRHSGDYTDRP